jgi:hypothetical protein
VAYRLLRFVWLQCNDMQVPTGEGGTCGGGQAWQPRGVSTEVGWVQWDGMQVQVREGRAVGTGMAAARLFSRCGLGAVEWYAGAGEGGTCGGGQAWHPRGVSTEAGWVQWDGMQVQVREGRAAGTGMAAARLFSRCGLGAVEWYAGAGEGGRCGGGQAWQPRGVSAAAVWVQWNGMRVQVRVGDAAGDRRGSRATLRPLRVGCSGLKP